MSADVEPLDWEDLPDLATIEECRRFLRIGDRQCRRIVKENDLEVRLGGTVRVSKPALRRYLQEQVGDVFEAGGEDEKPGVVEFPQTAKSQ